MPNVNYKLPAGGGASLLSSVVARKCRGRFEDMRLQRPCVPPERERVPGGVRSGNHRGEEEVETADEYGPTVGETHT